MLMSDQCIFGSARARIALVNHATRTLCREWLKAYKWLAYHRCMATMLMNGTKDWHILPLDSHPKAVRFCFHALGKAYFACTTRLQPFQSYPLHFFCGRDIFFFKPQTLLFLTIQFCPSRFCCLCYQPLCLSLTYIPSQSDSLPFILRISSVPC